MKRWTSRLLTGLAVLFVVAVSGWTVADSVAVTVAQAGARVPATLPELDLPQATSGQAAITTLGSRLPSVASAYGTTASELAKRFRQDASLVLDRKGRLFYVCPALPSGFAATDPAAKAIAAMAPLDQTFLLHSLPGSKRVIYLDFGGGTLSGTAWNAAWGVASIPCPRWDPNGNGQTWDDYDLKAIQMVWQRVAEDYAPYDVDVTTELPAPGAITRSSLDDDVYGTRVLVSPISSYYKPSGGVAYVGIYDQVDPADYYKPALVFPEGLSTEKCVGEACAHEAGHNLGLSHDGLTDGTGYYVGQGLELKQGSSTGWAPIMGAGYYRNVTQWSKGEYTNANNTEDDLAVINAHGLDFKADDYADTPAAAADLPAGADVSVDGVIGTRSDVDVFRFTAPAGTAAISVTPTSPGPDLDIEVRLLDAAGTLLQTFNGSGALYAQATVTLAAGTYYLQVDGVGEGIATDQGYSDYASLGWYHLRLNLGSTSPDVLPTAVAYAWPLKGTAPLWVYFSGAASSDPDGTIVSYRWDFGDNTSSTYPSPNHKYLTGGVFTATLTVTDDDGGTATDTIVINVNAPPTAVASATPLTGIAPLGVQFSSAGTTDKDGTVTGYSWDFGDGGTSTLPNPAHSYGTAGTYTAKLTVTDDRGGSGSATVTVTVLAFTLHVGDITLSSTISKSGSTVKGTVLVLDTLGRPVMGATVKIKWTGLFTGTASATTNSLGIATFSKSAKAKTGTITLAVTGITKTGATYQPAANLETSLTFTW